MHSRIQEWSFELGGLYLTQDVGDLTIPHSGPLNTDQERQAELAWALWDDVSAIKTVKVADNVDRANAVLVGKDSLANDWTRLALGEVSVSDEEALGINRRVDGDNGNSYAEAYVFNHTEGFDNFELGSTAFTTLVHEIGHSVLDSLAGVITTDGLHVRGDDRQTIMNETAVNDAVDADGYEIWHASTPMPFDITITQAFYGESTDTRTGNDTYGFHAQFSGPRRDVFDFNINTRPFVTIYDNGGINDTLDASGFNRPVLVDIRPGGVSSMLDGGHQDFAIIYDGGGRFEPTWIENAIGGNQDDKLYGNNRQNVLVGNEGSDYLDGRENADKMYGGSGNDTYVVDHQSDQVFDQPDQFGGQDKVITSLNSYDLRVWNKGAWIEDLEYTGKSKFVGYGNELNNSITSGDGNDHLEGLDGNDRLDGGKGADEMLGGTNDDTYYVDNVGDKVIEEPNTKVLYIDGAPWLTMPWGGNDTVHVRTDAFIKTGPAIYTLPNEVENGGLDGSAAFSLSGNSLANVLSGNLNANTIQGFGGVDEIHGGSGNDKLFGGDGNDELFGDQGDDELEGGHGDDTLDGGMDNDTFLMSTSGNDKVYGGPGFDTLSFGSSTSNLTIDLSAHAARYVGGGSSADGQSGWSALYTVRWTGIEAVTTGSGNDILTGDAGNNILDGGRGNDTFNLTAGVDVIRGGDGTDTMSLAGLSNDQKIDLSAGSGTYIGGGSSPDGLSGWSAPYFAFWDSIENLTTGAGDDWLAGTSQNNILDGGEGNDVFFVGQGNDTFIGGEGNDTVLFVNSGTDVVVDLSARHGTYVVSGGSADASGLWVTGSTSLYNLALVGIENVVGSATGDTLTGDGRRNTLVGEAGNDTLHGGDNNDVLVGGFTTRAETNGADGDDTLYGDAGDDLFQVLSGNDTVHGGMDNDTLSFAAVQTNLVVDLAAGKTTYVESGTYQNGNLFSGWVVPSTVTWDGIENVTTGSGSDTLTGDINDNILDGGDGSDTVIFHGARSDYAVERLADGSVKLTDSVAGRDGSDILKNIEKVHFTEGDVDVANLQTAPATTVHGYFHQSLPTGQTFDGTASWAGTVTGTTGADTVTFASSTFGVYLDLTREGGWVQGQTAGYPVEHLVSIENATGATNAMNWFYGDDNDNVFVGGNSGNYFDARGGDNTLVGGNAFDSATYFLAGAPVTVDLTVGKVYHGANVDTVKNIEWFVGTNDVDTFVGDNGDNRFSGVLGNDTIAGNGGADWLDGQFGNDTIDGGAGQDTIIGGADDDVLTGGTEADTFIYQNTVASRDRILDFNIAEGDRLDFTQIATLHRADLAIADNAAGNAVVTYGSTSTIELVGVHAADLIAHPSAFLLVA